MTPLGWLGRKTSTQTNKCYFNLFTPKYLNWTVPSLNLDTFIVANRGFSQKINNRMANSVDPDETARYEPSHLGLQCLQKYLYWSAGMKGMIARVHVCVRVCLHDWICIITHVNVCIYINVVSIRACMSVHAYVAPYLIMPYVGSKDPNQPAHSHSLFRGLTARLQNYSKTSTGSNSFGTMEIYSRNG